MDENPGMGKAGFYYYLQTFSKAHTVYGGDTVKTSNGEIRFWRQDLLHELVKLQRKNGEWFNDVGRWMESVPELVTAYALLSMEAAIAHN